MSFLLQSSKVLEEFCILTTTFPNSVGVERLRRRGLFSICFLAFFTVRPFYQNYTNQRSNLL